MKKVMTFLSDKYYDAMGTLAFKLAVGSLATVGAVGAQAAANPYASTTTQGYQVGSGGKSMADVITNTATNIKEPAFVGLGMMGLTVGAFQVYTGIQSFMNRSKGQGGQQGSVADDLKKIAGGGALAAIGGVAGMSSETVGKLFA